MFTSPRKRSTSVKSVSTVRTRDSSCPPTPPPKPAPFPKGLEYPQSLQDCLTRYTFPALPRPRATLNTPDLHSALSLLCPGATVKIHAHTGLIDLLQTEVSSSLTRKASHDSEFSQDSVATWADSMASAHA